MNTPLSVSSQPVVRELSFPFLVYAIVCIPRTFQIDEKERKLRMPVSPTKFGRVLFVCAGNTCRSPMAAALAGQILGIATQVESAGASAEDGASASKFAIEVMKNRGLDIAGHRSRSLQGVTLANFDRVVALAPKIADALLLRGVDASKLVVLDIPDPINAGLETYRATADAIERDLQRLFETKREVRPEE